jgi:hypothetical protein
LISKQKSLPLGYKKFFFIIYPILLISLLISFTTPKMTMANPYMEDKTGYLWSPYVEWSFYNDTFSGNPFVLIATAIFTHKDSGQIHTTGLFYDGGDIWKLRFTGTRTGLWTFTISSSDSELNGISGQVTIKDNPGVYGFTNNIGNKWARQISEDGNVEPFVPNFVMAFSENPRDYTEAFINQQIHTFFYGHGFNGFLVFLAANWVDIDSGTRWSTTSRRDPDIQTFEALERLITMTHAAGGVVHIWYVGDCSRQQCAQAGFGTNGARSEEERRLLRYIAARLGPLPGWIMSYGYDNDEHATTEDLRLWGDFLQTHLGWKHFLGARDQGQNINYEFWPEASWYSRGNWFNGVSYEDAVNVINSNQNVPHSFDERWWKSRLNEEDQRKLRWKLMLAGGASAIWAGEGAGSAYTNPEWFKTVSLFWQERFMADMEPVYGISNGLAIKNSLNNNYVFYSENTSSIPLDLSGMAGSQPAVAVDTKKTYAEIYLGEFSPVNQVWQAPFISDWAIAVGEFSRPNLSERIFLPDAINKSSKVSSFDALIPPTGLPGMIRDQTGLITSDLSVSSNYWLVIMGSLIFLFAIPTIYLIFKQRRTD